MNSSPEQATENLRQVLRVHSSYNFCSHGIELTSVSLEGAANGWWIWGHYPCPECERIIFDHRLAPPETVVIAGRVVPVLPTYPSGLRDVSSPAGDTL